MTEFELLELVNGAMDLMYESTTLYLSIVSGYLLVAYLVGSKLTRVQIFIISTLFIVGAGLQIWGLLTQQTAIVEYMAAKAEVSALNTYEQSVFDANAGSLIASAMTLGVFAALYFMGHVRYSKKS